MPRAERIIQYKGQKYTLAELSEMTGLSKDTLRKRSDSWGEVDSVADTPLVKNKNIYKKAKKVKKPAQCDLFLQLKKLWQPYEMA